MNNATRKTLERLDHLTVNAWTAFPIFILIVYFVFWCTFSLGRYPMDWIQTGVDAVAMWLNGVLRPEWLRALVVDGILAGVGGVLVFLPNIIILYLLISVMESTGYMGRAAFIMDKVMHGMGLHGKSFIPMIMGFGCNVPAIMATKDIQNPKNRLITILVIPFMSCSGRLPVYMLIVTAFFPAKGPLVLMGIYCLGMVMAICAAKILSLILPGKSEHDNVDIKPYSMPDFGYVLENTWGQAKEYLQKLAGPILIFSVALWIAGYFPRAEEGAGAAQQKEQSFIGMMGRTIEPVLQPIGLNWKDGVAIVAGIGAKELIVSTLGVMYGDGADNADADSHTGIQRALAATHTTAGAFAFMVFVLLYFPCIGTFFALRNATGSWKWAIGSCIHNIVVAWIVAFFAYNLALLF